MLVLIDHEASVRSNGVGEATLILNLVGQTHEDTKGVVRSLKRLQRFDCRNSTLAVVEEVALSRPVARGEILAHSRTPNAMMSSPRKDSIDAKILTALCGSVDR